MYIGLTIGIILGYFIGWFTKKYYLNRILSKGTGRLGVIEYNYLDHRFIIEVEELEEAGDLTKVRVIKIIRSNDERYSSSILLKYVKFKEWILTSKIIWYNNNSQKIRDNKIKEILGSKI
jgi:hypothetical protein